jgi:Ca2+-binding EF-hand superfamily protein
VSQAFSPYHFCLSKQQTQLLVPPVPPTHPLKRSNGKTILGNIKSASRTVDGVGLTNNHIVNGVDVIGTPGKPGGSKVVCAACPDAVTVTKVMDLYESRLTIVAPKVSSMSRDASDSDDGGDAESVLLPLAMVVFTELDSDKSGDLDRDEVRQLFNKVLHEEVEDDDFDMVFKRMDRNKDGKINFEEFKLYLPKFPKVSLLAELAFESMDKDDSDTITLTEIEEALSFYGINDEDKNPEDQVDVDALFDDLDDDLDGAVTYAEFKGAFLDLVRNLKEKERERKRARKAKRKSKKALKKQTTKVLPKSTKWGLEEV